MTQKLTCKKPSLLCLILLISFPSMITVLVSPALPAMAKFFSISNSYAQLLVTISIIGYAVGQLFYSPLANRFGRKPAAYIGTMVFIVSGLQCLLGIWTHHIELIIWGRLLMLLGASVGMIISFTIINDYFQPEEARPVVSYTVLAYAFMPAVGVMIGGVITTYISWVGCFYFMLAYGFFMLWIIRQLPETLLVKDLQALNLKRLLKSYVPGFKSLRLMLFSSIYGLMASFIYIIASGAPFIGIDRIGMSASVYGLVFLIPYSGQLIGALVAGRISKVWSSYAVMKVGYGSTIVGSLMMLGCFLLGWINVYTLVVPIFFIMMGLPMNYSSVAVMALVDYSDKATGSAIMSFVTMSVALLATVVLSWLPTHNVLMMPLLFVFVLVLSCIVFYVVAKRYQDS